MLDAISIYAWRVHAAVARPDQSASFAAVIPENNDVDCGFARTIIRPPMQMTQRNHALLYVAFHIMSIILRL
jgi:hypothetical protein